MKTISKFKSIDKLLKELEKEQDSLPILTSVGQLKEIIKLSELRLFR